MTFEHNGLAHAPLPGNNWEKVEDISSNRDWPEPSSKTWWLDNGVPGCHSCYHSSSVWIHHQFWILQKNEWEPCSRNRCQPLPTLTRIKQEMRFFRCWNIASINLSLPTIAKETFSKWPLSVISSYYSSVSQGFLLCDQGSFKYLPIWDLFKAPLNIFPSPRLLFQSKIFLRNAKVP